MPPGFAGFDRGPQPPMPPATTATVATAPRPKSATKRQLKEITPATPAPRTPGVRLNFDPATSRKKRQRRNQDEFVAAFFGPRVPKQPKTTTLTIFSFLSNEDFFAASLVSKEWNKLAMDPELWKFGDK